MASSDRLTRLKNARDNLEKEVEDETARRAALTAAGKPAPTSYSFGGRSMSWNEWLNATSAAIKAYSEMASAEEVPEASVRVYSA